MVFEDLAHVFSLGERLFTAERTPTLYRTWDEYELLNHFVADSDTCLVAESEGAVVGFALGTIIAKRRKAWHYGYLVWLGVSPSLAGSGIGGRLVQHLTRRFVKLGARIMMVDTEAHGPAHRFFEHMGFGNTRPHVYMTMNISQEATKGHELVVPPPKVHPAGAARSQPKATRLHASGLDEAVVPAPDRRESGVQTASTSTPAAAHQDSSTPSDEDPR